MPQVTVVNATTGVATERAMTAPEAAAHSALQAAATVVSTAAQDRKIEQQAAIDDLNAQYQAAMTRLDDIVTNGPTYTQVQSRDAMVDLARILRRSLRLQRATLASG